MAATSNPVQRLLSGPRRLLRAIGQWAGLLPVEHLLARRYCHFTAIPLRGIPRKHVSSALDLKLRQLDVYPQTGYAFQVIHEMAWVWYWNDERIENEDGSGNIRPYPAPLWRAPIDEGVQLLIIDDGYELEGRNPQGVYRSRWYDKQPNVEEIALFCRDLGIEQVNSLEPQRPQILSAPLSGWKIESRHSRKLPAWGVIAALTLMLGGAAAIWLAINLFALREAANAVRGEVATLRQQTISAAEVDQQIAALAPLVGAVNEYRLAPRQVDRFAELSRLGIVGPLTDTTIAEWAYRNNVVTATFRLGSKARSADVLSMLENASLFEQVILLPDPPPNSLRVQLTLPASQSRKDER